MMVCGGGKLKEDGAQVRGRLWSSNCVSPDWRKGEQRYSALGTVCCEEGKLI